MQVWHCNILVLPECHPFHAVKNRTMCQTLDVDVWGSRDWSVKFVQGRGSFGEHNSFGSNVWFCPLALHQRVEGTLENSTWVPPRFKFHSTFVQNTFNFERRWLVLNVLPGIQFTANGFKWSLLTCWMVLPCKWFYPSLNGKVSKSHSKC